MDYSQMNVSEFRTLKAAIKAELLRRCYQGSVASYGNAINVKDDLVGLSDIADGRQPSQMKAVDAFAMIDGILHVNDLGDLSRPAPGNVIPSSFNYKEINDKVNFYKSKPITTRNNNADSGCRNSCTGLCTNTCWDVCTGCTGCTSCTGCTGSCSGSCAGGCNGCSSCSGSCSSGCSGCGGCGGCDGACADMCTGGCEVGCSGGCKSCANVGAWWCGY